MARRGAGRGDARRLARPLEPDSSARAEALRAFRAALERPDRRALLVRPASVATTEAPGGDGGAAATIGVWRERPFAEILPEDGGETLWSGTFDRVVVRRAADAAALAAEVIDFKTDRVTSAQLDDRVAFYRPQIEGYARVLARMLSLPRERVTATLAFLESGVVRRV